MPSYDAVHFDPPAPVAQVMLRNPHSGATVSDVLLLVDTGADITLLPRTAVEQLGVPLLGGQRYELMGFDGNKSFASVVMLDLLFLQRAFRGRYLLIEEERGIMGRDILNHVILLLNGPHQQWSEHAP
jgi:predicted aspartyl protease